MGLFDKIKDLVIEKEVPQPTAEDAAAAKAAAPVAFTVTATGGVNSEMLEILHKALAVNKTVFSSFDETAEKIATVIADEATRYKTAVATVGCTKNELLLALASYDSVLANESDSFHKNIDSTLGLHIANEETCLTELIDEITAINQKLSQLTQDKFSAEARIADLKMQYEGLVRDFEATLATVRNDLATEKKKIEIYIVEVP